MVLELVAKEQGRDDASLRSWLAPGQPLPVEQSLLFALQIARGMAYAVSRIPGFVHRDLKPENVLVGADHLSNANLPGAGVNRLRATDFGLAAVLQDAAAHTGELPLDAGSTTRNSQSAIRHTQLTHGIVGTPLYMAPEQWKGEAVGVYTDVYALGCILYEMLAGQRAVSGRSPAALQRAHCAGDLCPLPEGLAEPVSRVVNRCLALEPGERYGDWEQVEGDLKAAYQAVAGHPAAAVEPAAALSRAERVQAGWSYSEMGASYMDIGKAEAALDYFERARQAGAAEGERRLEAAGSNHLGLAYAALGDARRAIGYYEQALVIAREIGGRRGEGHALGNMGNAYADLGEVRRAIGFYEQSLAIRREIGDRRWEGNDLGNLGIAYKNLGEVRRAIGYYEQHLEIAREIGDRRGEGSALGNLGVAYKGLGEGRRAIDYLEQATQIFEQIGSPKAQVTQQLVARILAAKF